MGLRFRTHREHGFVVTRINLWEVVASAASHNPDKVALVDGTAAHSYAWLATQVERCATWLYEHGLRPGDRLAICLRKGVEEVIATLAATRLAAVFVNIHPQWALGQFQHVATDSGARLLIIESARFQELRNLEPAATGALPQLVVLGKGDLPEGVLRWPRLDEVTTGASLDVAPPTADALAALLYTSGSTGRPKGVMHSQRNLLDFGSNVAQYLHAASDDRVLGLLPISFGYGLSQLLTTLSVGGTLVLQKTAFPAEVSKTLRAQEITGIAAVPMVWKQLLAYLDEQPTPFPALRYATNAGGKMSERNALRMQQHLPNTQIVLMYGSTEALRSTYVPPELFARKPGAIGKAIPNVQVFCINADGEDGDVKLAAQGEVGELVHCGSHISQGYWNNPEATQARFRPCPALRDHVGDNIVYFSGDMVRVDEDGVFWFVSRADWMVKSGGFRFSTNEVEDSIMRSELVGEVVAFALDDEQMEQVVHAVITAPAGAELSLEAVERYCWKHMPSYMTPRKFHLWTGALPTTANGKLDRATLWQQIQANGLTRPEESK
jgi:acyl-CoA synthetase (AMP-forming)/AMP-acid ligase II